MDKQQEFYRHLVDFSPYLILQSNCDFPMESLLAIDTVVDVSCIGSDESEYPGDASKREFIKLPLSTYAAAFLALQKGQHHYLHDMSFKLYLSQCSLYTSEASTVKPLSALASTITLPAILQGIDITEINLWMNLQNESHSALHYDGSHNVLCVLTGRKRVLLLPPSSTQHLAPYSAVHPAPNHSHLTHCQLQLLLQQQPCPCEYHTYDVDVGQALFIPEGWWHAITSSAGTAALNFWFSSALHKSYNAPSMKPYLLRKAARSLAEELLEEITIATLEASSRINADLFDDMSVEVFRDRLIAGALAAETLVLCSLPNQIRLWLPFAQQHIFEMSSILLRLGPEAAHQLTVLWESEKW